MASPLISPLSIHFFVPRPTCSADFNDSAGRPQSRPTAGAANDPDQDDSGKHQPEESRHCGNSLANFAIHLGSDKFDGHDQREIPPPGDRRRPGECRRSTLFAVRTPSGLWLIAAK
jgi:hypothetical protein